MSLIYVVAVSKHDTHDLVNQMLTHGHRGRQSVNKPAVGAEKMLGNLSRYIERKARVVNMTLKGLAADHRLWLNEHLAT